MKGSLEENKYVKCIYNMMIQDRQLFPNKSNWALHGKTLLSVYGFGDIWEAQGVENPKSFLEIFKQRRIKDNFVQEWHSRLENSTRARTFINIKNFKYQPYLDIINVKKFQTSLSCLRMSSHRLEVEAGRWTRHEKTLFENRKCKFCNNLEDEYHFVLQCELYKEIRKRYIANYFWERSNMLKFTQLFSSNVKKTVQNLGVFIEKVFILRNDSLMV